MTHAGIRLWPIPIISCAYVFALMPTWIALYSNTLPWLVIIIVKKLTAYGRVQFPPKVLRFSLILVWFKIEDVRKENLQTHLSERSQICDRHVHVNSWSSRRIISELFPQIDTYHNIKNDLRYVPHWRLRHHPLVSNTIRWLGNYPLQRITTKTITTILPQLINEFTLNNVIPQAIYSPSLS